MQPNRWWLWAIRLRDNMMALFLGPSRIAWAVVLSLVVMVLFTTKRSIKKSVIVIS